MKDAYGGILNLVFIVIFLVIVIGILGLVVSYTKAFKMKNAILSTIESYEGSQCDLVTSACYKKVKENAKRLAYNPTGLTCPADYTAIGEASKKKFYCLYKENKGEGIYIFKIIVQVDIDLPVINKMMGLKVFQVGGETRPVFVPEGS